MKQMPPNKSTTTTEAFFEPSVVKRSVSGARINARICEHINTTTAGRANRRRKSLLARPAPQPIDDSELDAAARGRDVRDAVRSFIRAAT